MSTYLEVRGVRRSRSLPRSRNLLSLRFLRSRISLGLLGRRSTGGGGGGFFLRRILDCRSLSGGFAGGDGVLGGGHGGIGNRS